MDKPASIFIADDNKINRLLLQSQLESYCNNITVAANGKTALVYLKQYKYDLILLDLQMPYFSGQELIKIIKQPSSVNLDTPVIAITAHTQSHQRKTLIEAGFDECLIKPILMEQLNELLNLWMPSPTIETSETFNKEEIETVDYATALLQRTSGDTALAIVIFNKLFTELPDQSLAIEQALKSNELGIAQETTHKLHGSVSFCGFFDLQILANNLETSFLESDLQSIHTNFTLLKNKISYFSQLKQSIIDQLYHP